MMNEFLGDAHMNVDLNARTLSGGGRFFNGVTSLGSFSHLSQTWLWIWDNPNFDWAHPAVAPVRAIYDVGRQRGITELVTGHLDFSGFPNPHQAATTLAIASGTVLGGHGVWSCRINEGKGSAYVHLEDAQIPQAHFDPITTPRLLMTAAEVWPHHHRDIVSGFLQHHQFVITMTSQAMTGRGPDGMRLTVQFDQHGRISAATMDMSGGAS